MLINGKNYDLNNIIEELSKGELNLSGKNEDLKILFDFFDTLYQYQVRKADDVYNA